MGRPIETNHASKLSVWIAVLLCLNLAAYSVYVPFHLATEAHYVGPQQVGGVAMQHWLEGSESRHTQNQQTHHHHDHDGDHVPHSELDHSVSWSSEKPYLLLAPDVAPARQHMATIVMWPGPNPFSIQDERAPPGLDCAGSSSPRAPPAV